MRLTIFVLALAFIASPPAQADAFDALVADAFRCVPLGDGEGIPTQGHRVESIGISIGLPLTWTDPVRTNRFNATVSSPDGRTRVTLSRQSLGEVDAIAVIDQTERRHLGSDRRSIGCVERVLARYQVEGASEVAVRLHAAGVPRSGRRTTHALHLVVDGALISVMVEQRWKSRTSPNAREADAILGSIRLLDPRAVPVSPSS
jgi:hypothetical protein